MMTMASPAAALLLSCKLFFCMALLLLLLPPNTAEAAVSCSEVYSDLYPCVSYVISGGGVPSSCCNGIRSLNDSATTTADRQAVCRCIQSATTSVSFTSYSLRLAAALPARCGVRVPYPMSPTTDCDMIP
uniref:Non-specific lipid-transfer protein n=1 Tax=Kalanchoe fedtschenkoi TaxID=63787 RepID=A0A7N0TRS1_KALFE